MTYPQERLLKRIQRCPKTGYALKTKGEIRMAAVLEKLGRIYIVTEIAWPKEEKDAVD